jgi:integrase
VPKRAAGLTARQVQTQKNAGLFADGGGLYLQVTPTGSRTWIYRFQLAGRRRDMGLGSTVDLSLAQARERAAAARRLVSEGIDPIERRKAHKANAALTDTKVMTFKECAETYIRSMREGWRNAKHASQWSSTLETYAYPEIGSLSVGAIDTSLVCKVLEPIWKTKTETASRIRGRIESILDYARVRGYRNGENPARWKGHLDNILPAKSAIAKPKHHSSLPYTDIGTFWPRLQVQDGLGARALEFVILTVTRSGETFGARWPEVDFEAKVWTIPSVRMKAGAEHRVPLTDPALALLRKLSSIRMNDYIFPGQGIDRPLSNMTMQATLRRMKVDVTPHGFRSTFRTWGAEQTSFPAEVLEAALSHTQGDKLIAAYQRGDLFAKRRELMAAWATFVCGGGSVEPATGKASCDGR